MITRGGRKIGGNGGGDTSQSNVRRKNKHKKDTTTQEENKTTVTTTNNKTTTKQQTKQIVDSQSPASKGRKRLQAQKVCKETPREPLGIPGDQFCWEANQGTSPDERQYRIETLRRPHSEISRNINVIDNDLIVEYIPMGGSRFPMLDPVNKWSNEPLLYKALTICSVLFMFLGPLVGYAVKECYYHCTDTNLFFTTFYGHNIWLLTVMVGHFLVQCAFTRFKRFGYIAYHDDGYKDPLCFNGFLITCLLTGIFFAFDYHGIYFNSNLIIFHKRRVFVTTLAAALLLSTLLWNISHYLCTSERNKAARGRFFLYNFWLGRELQPHYFKMDLKLALSRYRNVTSLVIIFSYLKYAWTYYDWKEVTMSHYTYSSTLFMQIVYVLLLILDEESIMATYYWNYEGFGCKTILANVMFPYYFFFLNALVLHKHIELKIHQMVFIETVFLIGVGVHLWTLGYKSVRPHGGRKAMELCMRYSRGPWKYVRHPDYLAQIIMHSSFAMPAFIYNKYYTIPSFFIILCIIRVVFCYEKKCKTRIHTWKKYKNKTPCMLFPGGF